MRSKGRAPITLIVTAILLSVFLAPVSQSANDGGEETTGTPAGWSDEIDIGDNPNYDFDPSLAVNGDTVHLLWRDAKPPSGPTNILYRKSTNAGVSWTSTQTIVTGGADPVFDPQIGVNGSNLHIVWGDYTGWNGAYYRNSTDEGMTWNPIKRITPDGMDCYGPQIYVNNSNVHIIWYDLRDGTDGEIYYRRSQDGGITWDNGQGVDADRRITFTPTTISGIQMVGDGSNISVVWGDERDGSFQVYWMISKDNGYTWEDGLGNVDVERKISNNSPNDCGDEAISMNGSNISIVWYEQRWPGPYYRLYYRNSSDMGLTWEPIQLLAGPWFALYHPDIEVKGNTIHIIWDDGNINLNPHNITYMNSTDGGNTWNEPLNLHNDLGISHSQPRIVTKDETLHIVWRETYADNSKDIYYKRYPEFPTDSIPPLLYHNPVIDANGRLPIPIFINITEEGAYGVDNVTLFYKNIGDATYSNTSLTFYNGTYWNGSWMGEIPKQNQTGLLPYYILATDHSSNSNQTIEYQIDVYDWPWPNVTAISPVNGANNVSIATPVTISFSEPMNISSVEDSFSYSNGTADWTSSNGSWSWAGSDTVGTFTPFRPLQCNSKYFIRLNSSIIKEADGHCLDGNNDSELISPETWLPRKDMLPFGERYFGSASLNGLLYAIGGNGGSSSVEVYNPANDTWYAVSSLNIGRESPTASACNGKIYVIGGRNPGGSKVATIEEYDPILDKWTLKASLQKARYTHAATVYEDKIYILGGIADPTGTTTDSVEIYDTTLNITYEETTLTDTRRYFDAVTYSGYIYVAGGVPQGGSSVRTVECYNPVSKQWTSLSDMYHRRHGLQLNVLNDCLYAMGGEGPGIATNERFNPYTNEWTNATNMPRARTVFGSGVVNGRIYTYGGRLGPNYYSHDVYIPDDDFHSSFTTGELVVTLDQGWNLISLPLGQSDTSLDTVLSSIDGKWDCVQTYNTLDPDHWKSYNTFKPSVLNDQIDLDRTLAFWINVNVSVVNLTVSGYIPTSTTIPLYAGWNLIGYPSLTEMKVSDAFWGTGVNRVEVFDPASPYLIKEAEPTYMMKPGEGYWVHVPMDTIWTVDW